MNSFTSLYEDDHHIVEEEMILRNTAGKSSSINGVYLHSGIYARIYARIYAYSMYI